MSLPQAVQSQPQAQYQAATITDPTDSAVYSATWNTLANQRLTPQPGGPAVDSAKLPVSDDMGVYSAGDSLCAPLHAAMFLIVPVTHARSDTADMLKTWAILFVSKNKESGLE